MAILNKPTTSSPPKAKCTNCGGYIYFDDKYNDSLCVTCRCSVCEKWVPGLMITDTISDRLFSSKGLRVRPYICKPCMKVRYKDRLCLRCKQNLSDTYARLAGEKRVKEARYCWNCIKSDQSLICWFCDSSALGPKGKPNMLAMDKDYDVIRYVVCSVCSGSPTCLAGKCRPTRPCHKCLAKLDAEVNDQIQHANGANEVAGLSFYFKQPLRFYRADSISDRRINRSKRMISAEIESTGLRAGWDWKHGDTTRYKKCICPRCFKERLIKIANLVHDIGGSIVPDESVGHMGFEINMPPAAGDHFLKMTDQVSNLLHESLAQVTTKAGTHLHVDASDYSWQDMRKFLILYSKIEPAILYTQPRERVMKFPKPHCRPCGDKYKKLAETSAGQDWKPRMVEAIYSDEYQRPPRLFRGNNRTITARYDFVNIQSWFFRGTIEIRGHSGTIDSNKIKNWGMIWASILDAAARMTEKEITQLPDDSPKEILLSITPSKTHPYLFNRWEVFEEEYHKKKKGLTI